MCCIFGNNYSINMSLNVVYYIHKINKGFQGGQTKWTKSLSVVV